MGLRGGWTAGQQKVSFSGSKWVYCFFTLSEGGREGGGDPCTFTTYGKYFQAIAAVAQNPRVDRSHGPDKSGSLFFTGLFTIISTIIAQRTGTGAERGWVFGIFLAF